MHNFQIAFLDFWQESGFLALLMVEKGQGLLFTSKKRKSLFMTSKKGRAHFWILKKWGVGAAPSEKRKYELWMLLNFAKSPFFSYWILWRIRFSHTEFCEESVFLMLNFVKCLKTDSIFPLDRHLIYDNQKMSVKRYFYKLCWYRFATPFISFLHKLSSIND